MTHKVKLSKRCKALLQNEDKQMSDCLFKNFVFPILQNLEPFSELQGKYKPSYCVSFVGSPMAESFRQCAEEYNLHHYHIGYRFYRDGNDSEFPGDVSDGIAHTRLESNDEVTTHIVIKLCASHGSPFTVPIQNASDD
jgi:hypothetical protein